jgi:hypothetical protein
LTDYKAKARDIYSVKLRKYKAKGKCCFSNAASGEKNSGIDLNSQHPNLSAGGSGT